MWLLSFDRNASVWWCLWRVCNNRWMCHNLHSQRLTFQVLIFELSMNEREELFKQQLTDLQIDSSFSFRVSNGVLRFSSIEQLVILLICFFFLRITHCVAHQILLWYKIWIFISNLFRKFSSHAGAQLYETVHFPWEKHASTFDKFHSHHSECIGNLMILHLYFVWN